MPGLHELDPSGSPLEYFGFELRRYRIKAGLSQPRLARRIGYTASMVSAVETGKRTPSDGFVAKCDEALQLDGALLRILSLLNRSPTPTWFRPYLDIEREAVALRTWQPLVIPGLLQTEDYARAIFQGEPRPVPEWVEEQVKARLERQRIFEREEPPMFVVVLDEGVLHRVVGSETVMIGQLKKLELWGQLPHITILVLPFSARATAGLEGPFVIARTPGSPDTVYIEAVGQGQLFDAPEVVQAIDMRYETIRAEALPQKASLHRIREIRVGMEQQQELASAQWRKSSHSGGSGGDCVEVAALSGGRVGVRDSKNPAGPDLVFTPSEWRAFSDGLKDGEFDDPIS